MTDAALTGTAAAKPARIPWHRLEPFALVGAWVLVVVIFSVVKPDVYPTTGNLQSVLGSQSVLLILAVGLLLPLTAGEFDLSVASTMSLSAMLVAVLNVNQGLGIGTAILIAFAVALSVGLLNGFLVVRVGFDSFIATLGTSTVMLGVIQWISKGSSVTGIDPVLSDATVGFRGILGLPLQFYYGLAVTVLTLVFLTWTPLGRRLLFVGQGRQVAHLSGLHVDRLRMGAFVGSAGVAALAGVVYAGVLGGSDPSSGQSYLLPAFAACYLGSTAILPGRFNAIGTFVAVFFLASGVVGLQMLGAQNFVQQLFYGGALIVAVAASQLIRRGSVTSR